MALVTHGQTLASTSNAATYATASFTPAENDLLLLFSVVTATADAGAVSDSLGGAWTNVTTATKNTSADKLFCFVRDTKVSGAAMTVTMDVTGDNGTGAVVFVARLAEMVNVGAAAIRQSAALSNQTGVSPAITFGSATLPGNPVLAFIANVSNPAAMDPSAFWTEGGDTGYNSPVTGGEYQFVNTNPGGTSVGWGNNTSTQWGGIIVEIDASGLVLPVPPTIVLDSVHHTYSW